MTWMDKKKELISTPKILDNGKPLFSFIEFNISNYCNRECSFCPVTKPDVKKEMPFELYRLTINELMDLDYEGLIGFSGFCEPTLHSRIKEFVNYARQCLPNATIVINSNGDVVNANLVEEYKIIGLDYLIVSAYDEDTYNKVAMVQNDIVVINKRFAGDMIKNNRAGALYTANGNLPLSKQCYYPFYMLYIEWDGNVLFCSHNYRGLGVVGNILHHNLVDIWFEPNMEKLREELTNSRRSISPCNECDVIGTMMGEEVYELWKS